MLGRRSFGLLAVFVAASFLLAGCVTGIAPTQALIAPGSGNAAEVAVAVQSNGTKHYVWTECTSGICKLEYLRTLLGIPTAQLEWTPPSAGETYTNPDIAATDDGQAFIVWRGQIGSGSPTDYYTVVPASVSGAPARTTLVGTTTNDDGLPTVKARGNIVYAVFAVPDGAGASDLRYLQLRPLAATSYYVVNGSGYDFNNARLAIDSGGKLHVAFFAKNLTSPPSYVIGYGNNQASPDMPAVPIGGSSTTNNLSLPDIALDSANKASIVYSYDSGSSDVLQINTIGGSVTTVPLNAAQNPWRLKGNPHIEVFSDVPTIAFSASNSATPKKQIWTYTPPSSGTDPGPSQVTNDDIDHGEPLIVKENSTNGDIPVYAWRTYTTVTLPPPTPISFECYGAAFETYAIFPAQQVFGGTGGCFNGSQDLASNGPWVAGVWTDQLSTSNTRMVPWTTFNANVNYTPLIVK